MSGVSLSKTVKKYGDVEVIHGIDLRIEDGEFVVFVGPSGCGKSTLLRMIAGLEGVTSGRIDIGTRNVTGADPADRGVAMVFQTYALYPHMTVAQNMGFGLRMTGHDKARIDAKVRRAAQILKLEPLLDRKPAALSGGQRQRVAIGRAIVRGPEVFLFDEPLSNLDAELRVEMRVEIAQLHRDLGTTMIYVTHDQTEAMTMADRIVVLRDGRIEQVGAPLDLYRDPHNRFVAGFIGSPSMNFIEGTCRGAEIEVVLLGQSFPAPAGLSAGQVVTVGIRPEHLTIDHARDDFEVGLTEALGGVSYTHLEAPTVPKLIVEERGETRSRRGESVGVRCAPDRALFFDPESGARLGPIGTAAAPMAETVQ